MKLCTPTNTTTIIRLWELALASVLQIQGAKLIDW